jgi:hypothetical protein
MKKMLVPFDETQPSKQIKDFVYPEMFSDGIALVGIAKQKKWNKAMVVYTARDITANDVFARIVDAGIKIDSVDNLFNNLESYVRQLENLKIGNIVGIESDDRNGFKLVKISNTPLA